MEWFYALNGERNGPVSESQLQELFNQGKINLQTLVWREGMTDWQNWATVRSSPPAIPTASTGCAECGRVFPKEDLVQLGGVLVCAACKPILLQRMSEGATISNSAGGLWRQNKILVTRSETLFPDRCVKCNAPANGYKLKRALSWFHPAYYLLLFLNLLILLIVALCVRKKATLHVGLCALHRSKRNIAIAIGWTCGLGGSGIIILGIYGLVKWHSGGGWLVLAGTVAFLFGVIYANFTVRIVYPKRIADGVVKLKGAGPNFLEGLPEWTGL